MLESHKPYLLAACYCLISAIVILFCFDTPPPRFMDFFLLGIAFAGARWSWRPALMIYVISLFIAAWVLPPRNSIAIADKYDQYRMSSYSVTAIALVVALDYAKRSRNGSK
jgi:hypothetical protein